MKWYETDRFALLCFLVLACELLAGWAICKSVSIPSDGVVITLPKGPAEALASAIETVVRQPLREEDARRIRRELAEAWCRASGFLLAGITTPGFWLLVCATGDQ
jgi:hypothetical protein